jgi:hypothetical protein
MIFLMAVVVCLGLLIFLGIISGSSMLAHGLVGWQSPWYFPLSLGFVFLSLGAVGQIIYWIVN